MEREGLNIPALHFDVLFTPPAVPQNPQITKPHILTFTLPAEKRTAIYTTPLFLKPHLSLSALSFIRLSFYLFNLIPLPLPPLCSLAQGQKPFLGVISDYQ